MRNYKKTIGALAAITAISAGVASAEIEGDVYAGYATSYNFRGVNLGDDLAEAGLNLSTACPLTQGTVSVGVWYGSLNDSSILTNNQLNTSIGWSKDLGGFDLGLGYIRYDHDSSVPITGDTSEVYLSLGTELFQGIRGGVTAFYDIDANDGWYLEAALSKSIQINDCVSLDLGAGASFYESYSSAVKDGFNHWFVSAALPWQARENLVVTPYVKYVDVDGGQFSGIGGSNFGENEVIGGIRASVSF